VASRFYVDALGCCPDPFRQAKIQSMHVNVGVPRCSAHTSHLWANAIVLFLRCIVFPGVEVVLKLGESRNFTRQIRHIYSFMHS